jgi:dipeptidyl aminopeptidase/acylaminoacyl peptidase
MISKIKHLLGAALALLVTTRLKQNAKALSRLLLVALAIIATASSEAAPGGGGGGTGGGTIYYIGAWNGVTNGGTAVMKTMDSDGGNKNQLGFGLFGPPSRTLHKGYRWFVATRGISGQYYPDGTARRELFAFRSDYDFSTNNNAETRVQLTDDNTLDLRDGDWLPGDQKISFIGRRWSSAEPGATVVEGGLYVASLVFGADGSIVGLASEPFMPVISMPLVESQPGDWRPDIAAYSWDPAGERVTYTSNDSDLWVANLFNVHTLISTRNAHAPQWSPDGSKIAFTGGGIWTIKPNGATLKRVVADTPTWFPSHVFWSPTGSHFVFAGEESATGNSDLFRVPSSGGTWVNLTSTAAPLRDVIQESQGGWR